jgi:hypothetical protein
VDIKVFIFLLKINFNFFIKLTSCDSSLNFETFAQNNIKQNVSTMTDNVVGFEQEEEDGDDNNNTKFIDNNECIGLTTGLYSYYCKNKKLFCENVPLSLTL